MSRSASRVSLQSACRFLLAKREAARAKHLQLWQQAATDAERILALIIRHRPRRVLQWGSVLNREHFSEISDIDFAVEGLEPMEFDCLHALAEDLTSFPIHLVRWETTPSHYRELLLRKGKIVYEAA